MDVFTGVFISQSEVSPGLMLGNGAIPSLDLPCPLSTAPGSYSFITFFFFLDPYF